MNITTPKDLIKTGGFAYQSDARTDEMGLTLYQIYYPPNDSIPWPSLSEGSPDRRLHRDSTDLNNWRSDARLAFENIAKDPNLSDAGRAKQRADLHGVKSKELDTLQSRIFEAYLPDVYKARERAAKAHALGELPERTAADVSPEFLTQQLAAMDANARHQALLAAAASDDPNDRFMLRTVLNLPTFVRATVIPDHILVQVKSIAAEKNDPGSAAWSERMDRVGQYAVDSMDNLRRWLHFKSGVPIPKN